MLAMISVKNLRRPRSLASDLSHVALAIEDWLEARASARALYAMDDRTLSDLAISRSDVEAINRKARAVWSRKTAH
jgi:uncharacterized protein YjiS (DUF1127 family)